ncbi:hypothetical protein [Bacillus cereus group sp. BfR-BA-01380]|uniref:hypothetical protein n=1 Tax=Bacillus cereus group sp. BfR-BA-01380 TaxID=2920324 RepID=UPI001F55D4B8|nr:hypothetical protein [Bacillus cereus group sp. BfR-BA-01380]
MIIDLTTEREKRKHPIKQLEVKKVPIVERIYEVDGEFKFEISDFKETPVKWLDD